jgi:hypothetical protein
VSIGWSLRRCEAIVAAVVITTALPATAWAGGSSTASASASSKSSAPPVTVHAPAPPATYRTPSGAIVTWGGQLVSPPPTVSTTTKPATTFPSVSVTHTQAPATIVGPHSSGATVVQAPGTVLPSVSQSFSTPVVAVGSVLPPTQGRPTFTPAVTALPQPATTSYTASPAYTSSVPAQTTVRPNFTASPPAASGNGSYTFQANANGTVSVYQNGKQVSLATPQQAALSFGYQIPLAGVAGSSSTTTSTYPVSQGQAAARPNLTSAPTTVIPTPVTSSTATTIGASSPLTINSVLSSPADRQFVAGLDAQQMQILYSFTPQRIQQLQQSGEWQATKANIASIPSLTSPAATVQATNGPPTFAPASPPLTVQAPQLSTTVANSTPPVLQAPQPPKQPTALTTAVAGFNLSPTVSSTSASRTYTVVSASAEPQQRAAAGAVAGTLTIQAPAGRSVTLTSFSNGTNEGSQNGSYQCVALIGQYAGKLGFSSTNVGLTGAGAASQFAQASGGQFIYIEGANGAAPPVIGSVISLSGWPPKSGVTTGDSAGHVGIAQSVQLNSSDPAEATAATVRLFDQNMPGSRWTTVTFQREGNGWQGSMTDDPQRTPFTVPVVGWANPTQD